MSRRSVALTCWMLLMAIAPIVTVAEEELGVKAFRVDHRPLIDAAELVDAVLSDKGTMSLRPRLKTIVVEDYRSVLTKVESLIRDFDAPPRNVQLTLNLIVGTDESKEQDGRTFTPSVNIGAEIIDVMNKLEAITKWTKYEVQGSSSLQSVEGGTTMAVLSDEYRVEMAIDSVDEAAKRVYFKHFKLQKRVPTAEGDRYDDVYATSVISPLDRLNLMGVASGPDSSKALFLTLQAELR